MVSLIKYNICVESMYKYVYFWENVSWFSSYKMVQIVPLFLSWKWGSFNSSLNFKRALSATYFDLFHLEGELPFLFECEDFLKNRFNVDIFFGWCFNVCALPHLLEYEKKKICMPVYYQKIYFSILCPQFSSFIEILILTTRHLFYAHSPNFQVIINYDLTWYHYFSVKLKIWLFWFFFVKRKGWRLIQKCDGTEQNGRTNTLRYSYRCHTLSGLAGRRKLVPSMHKSFIFFPCHISPSF